MNRTGQGLIDSLCDRLDFLDKRKTDSNITILLRSLDRYELNQLITFGKIDTWERERILRQREQTK